MIVPIVENSMQDNSYYGYVSIVAFVIATFFIAKVLFALPSYIAKKKYNQAKLSPYECGTSCEAKSLEKLNVGFELVAMMFLILDCEVIFLLPAVANIKLTSVLQFTSIAFFLLTLIFALAYEIKKGLLKW